MQMVSGLIMDGMRGMSFSVGRYPMDCSKSGWERNRVLGRAELGLSTIGTRDMFAFEADTELTG